MLKKMENQDNENNYPFQKIKRRGGKKREMKYIKRSLIVFIFLLMSLFALKFYISTKNFRGVLTSILKSSGLNVEFRNVKLIGFNKIQIDNLKVKDLAGNVVIDAKKSSYANQA